MNVLTNTALVDFDITKHFINKAWIKYQFKIYMTFSVIWCDWYLSLFVFLWSCTDFSKQTKQNKTISIDHKLNKYPFLRKNIGLCLYKVYVFRLCLGETELFIRKLHLTVSKIYRYVVSLLVSRPTWMCATLYDVRLRYKFKQP